MVHHALGAIVAVLGMQASKGQLPEVVVDRDDVEIDRSCRVVIAPGTVIRDEAGDGVIQIRTSGVVLEFAPGSVLRGAEANEAPDTYAGVGIRVEGAEGVTLRGIRVEGFKVGVWATAANGLVMEDCRGEDLWRQRLRSTPAAEDQSDWLWPHKNDGNEWVTNYGAALCIEDSDGVTVRRCRVRRGQNGLILDCVNASRIYDNDFSFLSGWGLAMWRSSGNIISRNALDFCVRGYSHGVYNRGQDSAGILMFQWCSNNVFAENSATHSGDGFFGFGGGLGEQGQPPEDFRGRGCNGNIIVGNDFSYAPAHGLELTFSFDNVIAHNRLVENAICGIWGGYSQRTRIVGNAIERNGLPGRAEGGGINIEHGAANVIRGNDFRGNTVGVALWYDADEGLVSTPWAAANHPARGSALIGENTFSDHAVAMRLHDAGDVNTWANTFESTGEAVRQEGDSTVRPIEPGAAGTVEIPSAEVLGQARPVGARPHLQGREKIIMGEWGPWDHESVLVRRGAGSGDRHVYELFGVRGDVYAASDDPGVKVQVEHDPALSCRRVTIAPAQGAGVQPYTVILRGEGIPAEASTLRGTLVAATWDVTFFPWTIDPREDPTGWRAQAAGPRAVRTTLPALALPFAHRGPAQFIPNGAGGPAADWKDRFGTIATATLRLPKGRYRLSTLSDDGVRVTIRPTGQDGGAPLIDNWTWHAPTRDSAEYDQPADGEVTITVEHFELDGHAVLTLDIEAAD